MTCYSGGTLEIYIEPHHPRPKLMIIGNLPVAQSLLHLGRAMNFETIAVDPEHSPAMRAADTLLRTLDDIQARIDARTFVVIATHGVYDEPAIEAALRAQAQYVGLVASPKRGASVREYLRERGLGDADLLAFKAPAGIDIQARRGDEIALSVMAEIVQRRRGSEAIRSAIFGTVQTEQSSSATAICPTCHGEVDIATAQHSAVHDGVMYYFCCPNCKRHFVKNPGKYLQPASPQ
jgi:xanthine dehydrogenase accessory factor